MVYGRCERGAAALIQRLARISGRVQGVGFRNFVLVHVANFTGLKGYVKNLASGEVEVLLLGESQYVEAMLDFCRKGPRFSRVDRIVVEEQVPDPELKAFRVIG